MSGILKIVIFGHRRDSIAFTTVACCGWVSPLACSLWNYYTRISTNINLHPNFPADDANKEQ